MLVLDTALIREEERLTFPLGTAAHELTLYSVHVCLPTHTLMPQAPKARGAFWVPQLGGTSLPSELPTHRACPPRWHATLSTLNLS